MKKLSLKILLILALVLSTSMFFMVLHVNRAEKKMLLEEASSRAESINMQAFNILVTLMSPHPQAFDRDNDIVHKIILEMNSRGEGKFLELRFIHKPGIAGTFTDKKVAAKHVMNETEYPRDEKEREALAGTETRDSPLVKTGGKTIRTIRHIRPIKVERRCLLCHRAKEGETIAALSTSVSLEASFQKLKRTTIWNSVLLCSGFFLILSALFLFLHTMVSKPLREMSGIARNIADNGDLSKILEVKSSDEIGELAASFNKMTRSLRKGRLEIINRLALSAEYRDEETGQHIQRTSLYAAALARKMGLDERTVESIFYATPMHDLGKIGIPDLILLKPGKLDSAEFEIMKQHPIIGTQILKDSEVSFIKTAEKIALTHHEKWDGSGYPKGLKGEDIPIEGQIVAIADVFDALTSKRPYRKDPFSVPEAFAIMREERGKHFNSELLDAFLSLEGEIFKIKETHKDGDASFLSRIVLAVGKMTAMEGEEKRS